MKKVLAIAALLALVSCSKETPTLPIQDNVYFRIETVNADGKSTYTPISVVRLK